MKTRQYFKFKRYDAYRGTWNEAGYLLMPDEVAEFQHLVWLFGDYSRAFQRLTGKDASECRDIVLHVEYLPSESKEGAA
jgi:hypothetical protein